MLEPPFTWALQNSMIPIQFTCVKNEYWLPIGKHVNSKAINSNLSTPVLKIRVCSTSLLKQVLELALFLNGCNAIKLCVSVSYLLSPHLMVHTPPPQPNHNPLQLIKQCQTLSDEMQPYQKIWLRVLLFFPPLLCGWIIPFGVHWTVKPFVTEITTYINIYGFLNSPFNSLPTTISK